MVEQKKNGLKLRCTLKRTKFQNHIRKGEVKKKNIIPATLKKVGQMVNSNPKIHKVAQNRHGEIFSSMENVETKKQQEVGIACHLSRVRFLVF
jgi:hypothetical protein